MIDQLARIAADTAMQAAAEYIYSRRMKPDLDAVTTEIRIQIREAIGPALADAKEALDAGMSQLAEAFFIADMKVAGIRAARKFERGEDK